jgi:hypothetical protein
VESLIAPPRPSAERSNTRKMSYEQIGQQHPALFWECVKGTVPRTPRGAARPVLGKSSEVRVGERILRFEGIEPAALTLPRFSHSTRRDK